MSQSAAPAPQQPAVVPRQVAAVSRQRDAVLPRARGSGRPVAAAIVRLNRAREPRALSTSFPVERSLRPPVPLFALLRDKATPGGTSIEHVNRGNDFDADQARIEIETWTMLTG